MASLKDFDVLLLQMQVDGESMQYLNFGFLLVERGWPKSGEAHVKLAGERQWDLLENLGAQVDILRQFGEALREDLSRGTSTREGDVVVGELLRRYKDQFSLTAKVRELHKPIQQSSAARELETLTHLYLERPKWTAEPKERKGTGRTAIKERMEQEFRVWGVLGHPAMRTRFEVREWDKGTKSRMRVDFGYATRDGREFKMYQAVDATRDVEALRLARVWPKLRDGVRQKAQREARLTAVVGEGPDEEAVEVMEEAGVRVAMVGEMERIAQMAAEELL